MASGKIPVFDRPRRLTLLRVAENGSAIAKEASPTVDVRRIGKSADLDVQLAVPQGRLGSAMKYVEIKTRLAIVGAMGLTMDGAPLEFSLVPHGTLGNIAAAEVWDALDERDVAMVLAVSAGEDPETVYESALKRVPLVAAGGSEESAVKN